MILVPDTAQKAVYDTEIAPNLRPGQLLMFAHGFNIRFGRIDPRTRSTSGWSRPRAPATSSAASTRRAAACRPCSRSTATRRGTARARVLAYARGVGSTRAGVLETTFKEETETDLFGEQALLCGGVSALVKAAFETLVEAGYQPELAYFETMHELKLIVDLMYRGGLNFMRFSVSDTAEYGDYVSGPRVTEGAKATMKDVLTDIQTGAFATRWIAEKEAGGDEFQRLREQRPRPPDRAGRRRAPGPKMPFLNPVVVEAGQAQAAADRRRRRRERGALTLEATRPRRRRRRRRPVRIFDTTLRDGEQAPGAGLPRRRSSRSRASSRGSRST